MAMTLREANKEFEDVIRFAFDAADAYSRTKSHSLEEAILKLNITGKMELADDLESELEKINNYGQDNRKDN